MINSEPLFLTTEELVQLTGLVRPSAQARVLNLMGIDHRVRPDGVCIVLRDAISTRPKPAKEKVIEPNWSALKK